MQSHRGAGPDASIETARHALAHRGSTVGSGPVITAWSPSEFIAQRLLGSGTRASGSLVAGLLDVVSAGIVGRVQRGLQSDEREQELLAELARARRGLHRMEERDHEHRNAVESVRVMISMLGGPDDADAEGERRMSRVTQAEMCRIGRLLERGAEPGPTEDYLLTPVVEAAVLSHGLGMEVEIDVPADLVVRGCPTALTHVVSNLLSNCRRYATGSKVRVRARRTVGALALEVVDDGARPGATPPSEGVGIGLSVCRRLLRAEGGRVETPETRPDGGCIVRVVLREAS